MSWKIKRTVFRDYISIIQPEEDWSLFNLTQNIKQKVYNLPRKVFEKKEKPKEREEKQKEKDEKQPIKVEVETK